MENRPGGLGGWREVGVLQKGNMRDPVVIEIFCLMTVLMSISWL